VSCLFCGKEVDERAYLLLCKKLIKSDINTTNRDLEPVGEDVLTETGDALFCRRAHEGCYEDAFGELLTELQNTPPVEHPEGEITCPCGSDILKGESYIHVGLGHMGVLRQRHFRTFILDSEYEGVFCLCCARMMGDHQDVAELCALSESGECPRCTVDRCWRQKHHPCNCVCHSEYMHVD